MTRRTIRLPKADRAALHRVAAREGAPASELVRKALARLDRQDRLSVPPGSGSPHEVQLTLRLPRAEDEALARAADRWGMSAQAVVRAVVRSLVEA